MKRERRQPDIDELNACYEAVMLAQASKKLGLRLLGLMSTTETGGLRWSEVLARLRVEAARDAEAGKWRAAHPSHLVGGRARRDARRSSGRSSAAFACRRRVMNRETVRAECA